MNHYFSSIKKTYGRYCVFLTQHMFSSDGLKKYGSVNLIIILDDVHIIHSETIKKMGMRIEDEHIDQFWNDFIVKHNHNLDIYEKLGRDKYSARDLGEDPSIKKEKQVTLSDFDVVFSKIQEQKNINNDLRRKYKKLADHIRCVLDELEVVK